MANTTSTTSFRADISQLKSAMQQAARQVKLANSEFKAATAGLDDWSKSAQGLKAKLTQLDSTLSAQKKQLSLLEKELELTEKEYGKNSAAADRVRVSLNNQKAAIAKTESEIQKYDKELKNAEKYGDNFTDTLEDMNDATEEVSDGFTVMKGALADLVADGIRAAISAVKDFAKETIKAGANFEQSMKKVQAISGASGEELDALTAKAKEMGENTVFSATEAADAFQYMAMAGWDTEDMLNGIEGIMSLAAASGADLATTSDIVTDALTAMGYSAKDAGKFADVMAAASANANTNVELMGATFQYAAPIIGALGMNIEDSAVAIGLMANAGIKGQKAGTALRSILSRLSTDAGASSKSLGALGTLTEELGVQFYNTDGTVRDLNDILGEAREAWKGLSAEQQTSYGKTIAGQEALSGWLAIMNAAPADIDKLTDAVNHADGAAADMAATMNDSLNGQMTLLRSKIEGVQIQIYEKLAPAMKQAVGEIGNVIDSIDWGAVGDALGDVALKLVKFVKTVIQNFDEIKEVALAVGKVLLATFVVNKITAFIGTITTVISAFKALKTATETATTAQKLLNLAQAATPIGLVTAAIAGLTTAVIVFAGKNKEAKQTVADLTEEEKEQINTIYATRDAYADLKAKRDENVEAINAEYSNYESLLTELDGLVDANGKVKEGYEDRVNFILTTLNEAVGTEMKLVDGVIENYQEEKKTLEDLIQTKKAEAILDANKEAYTTAIKEQNKALQDYINTQKIYQDAIDRLNGQEKELQRLSGLTVEEYAKEIGSTEDLYVAERELVKAQAELAEGIDSTKISIGQAHKAMDTAEESYVNYISTIKNYEGLSSAIISKDTDKISQALTQINNDFISAETGTRQSLEKQVKAMEQNYEAMKQAVEEGSAVVTAEMVDEAKSMVDKANNELAKFEAKAKISGSAGMQGFIDGMGSKSRDVDIKAETIRISASKTLGADVSEFEKAGLGAGQGYLNGLILKLPDINTTAEDMGSGAVDALNKGQESNSPSALTTASGENFGQGFINGMDNKKSSIWDKAYSLAQRAIAALKAGQQEGSPSKITYQSGIYFVQGYVNGIASMQSKLQNTIAAMVKGAFKELNKMSHYNFNEVAGNASEKFAAGISAKMSYMMKKLQYENEQKLAGLDADIEKQEKVQEAALAKAEKDTADRIRQLEAQRALKTGILETELEELETKDDAKSKKRAAKLRKQIEEINNYYDGAIKGEQQRGEVNKKKIENIYKKQIEELEKMQKAYSNASKEFLAEFQTAMNEYQQAAQDLIDDTINGISDRYTARYDALMSKQDSLIKKLKDAGSLFNVSSAGIMTVNDLTEQTRQIKEYTSKLAKIKNKVSAELFDEIASFDMKEGSAYIDRLLSMSTEDLKAYNEAYTEKLEAAEKAGESIYKKDFKQIAKDYKDEIKKAFEDLPKQLEELGESAFKSFIKGLTDESNFMSDDVKTMLKAMIDSFKAGLGETFGDSTQLTGIRASVAESRGVVTRSNVAAPATQNTVNNYNLVQNNTSPKSLSALETYQARREQLAMVKAFTS